MTSLALVVGAGSGLSAAIARALAQRAYHPILIARDINKLDALCAEVNGTALQCDASKPDAVAELFRTIDDIDGAAGSHTYAGYRQRHNAVYRCLLWSEGLRQLFPLRDGQVCLTRPVPIIGTRASPPEHSHRACGHRWPYWQGRAGRKLNVCRCNVQPNGP